jgi:hypothetical protein
LGDIKHESPSEIEFLENEDLMQNQLDEMFEEEDERTPKAFF